MEGKIEKNLVIERKIFELITVWVLTVVLTSILGFVGGFFFYSGLSYNQLLIFLGVFSVPIIIFLYYLVKSTNKVINLARG